MVRNPMAIAALQAIIDRIDTWAPERQERAAAALVEIESGADKEWTISDEDIAEIERRMADEDAPTMSLEEFRAEFADLLK